MRLSVRDDALVVGQHHAAAPLPERLHALAHGRPDAPVSLQLDTGGVNAARHCQERPQPRDPRQRQGRLSGAASLAEASGRHA
jgi:hypothetical protein